MTCDVSAPGPGQVQSLWLYPPCPGDAPQFLCDPVKEGFAITDLASARRFFWHKCRWSREGVRGITAVHILEAPSEAPHLSPCPLPIHGVDYIPL
jgi:hypothetical protein